MSNIIVINPYDIIKHGTFFSDLTGTIYYDSITFIHEKRQVDVKYIPRECKIEGLDGRFYQYTILDECSRKRALYFTNEHSMYETVNALKYAKKYFGCLPKEIQTDNGFEFSDKARRNKDGKNSREYDNCLEVFMMIEVFYI